MNIDTGDYGRIHRVAFKGGLIALFALAMLALVGRLTIRWVYHKRYFADDYVLLFGCTSLVASFVLNVLIIQYIYIDMLLILGPIDQVFKLAASPGFSATIARYQRLVFSTEVLNWLAIFSVKFSYLLFFRQMVDRLKGIMTYWKITLGVVVVSCAYCICALFIGCPHFGTASIECAQRSGYLRTLAASWVSNVLDMLTDLLIVAVPIALLRKVKIRPHQKIILGSFLCLSLCMFAVTLVRGVKGVIRGNAGDAIDVQWFVFWHFIEASVAVMVVSLTAFRSLYSLKTIRADNEKRRQPWLYSNRQLFSLRKKQRKVDSFGDTISSQNESSSNISGQTMTGVHSSIEAKAWANSQQLQPRQETVYGEEQVREHDRHMP